MHKSRTLSVLLLAMLGFATTASAAGPMAQIIFPTFENIFMGFILFGLASTILWIVSIVDLIGNKHVDSNEKILWLLMILFLHLLGTILYFVLAPRASRPSRR